MLGNLIVKFGGVKVVIAAFALGGVIAAVPTALFVNNVWNGAVKNKTIKELKNDLGLEQFAKTLAEKNIENLENIRDEKTQEISDLRKENSRLSGVNASLAGSRAATNTHTINQGEGLKNEAAKTDKCAVTDMDNGLRLFANGDVFKEE